MRGPAAGLPEARTPPRQRPREASRCGSILRAPVAGRVLQPRGGPGAPRGVLPRRRRRGGTQGPLPPAAPGRPGAQQPGRRGCGLEREELVPPVRRGGGGAVQGQGSLRQQGQRLVAARRGAEVQLRRGGSALRPGLAGRLLGAAPGVARAVPARAASRGAAAPPEGCPEPADASEPTGTSESEDSSAQSSPRGRAQQSLARVGSRLSVGRRNTWRGSAPVLFSDFMSTFFKLLWPNLGPAASLILLEKATEAMDAAMQAFPSFRAKVHHSVNAGSVPPEILAVYGYKRNAQEDGEIEISGYMRWKAHMDVELSMGPIKLMIDQVTLEGPGCLISKPLLNQSPVVGGFQIFYCETPKLELRLNGLGGITKWSTVDAGFALRFLAMLL
ncbi:unnamed protein product [Prorocentrum cordatum]|uniref:SMP-LTD domain-containing protein n=1 Tax=Prorocentrum cordatum TaxID=2364126 RepID=A0ABN9V6J4_9DINO|nr:unnamed protein product [Polarella glacialis]